MKSSDKARFALAVEALASSYRVPATTALIEGYWMALDDLDIDAIERACRSAVRSCKHMPVPVDIREMTGSLSPATRAVAAWSAVKKAVRFHGAYRSVCFDDPVVNAAIRNLGGWVRVCSMDASEFDKWLSKDFQRVYIALSGLQSLGDEGKYLPGISEGQNALNGRSVEPPHHVQVLAPSTSTELARVG